MRARLQQWWAARSPRERMVVSILAVVVAAALYYWLVESAYRARAQLRESISTLRAQALRLDADAAELARVRAAAPPPVPATDLRSHLQAQAEAAGLGKTLVRIDAQGATQAHLVLGSVAFAEWLSWVKTLQAQHIRLSNARIEALSTPGMVSVTAAFQRPRKQ